MEARQSTGLHSLTMYYTRKFGSQITGTAIVRTEEQLQGHDR